MKQLIVISIFIFSSALAFGQTEPKVVVKYKDTERLGNFITRWYYDIRGTSLVWKENLILYSDSTYHYTHSGGECGTFDIDTKGSWTIKSDTLILDTGNEMFSWRYVILNDKLYSPNTDIKSSPNNWVIK